MDCDQPFVCYQSYLVEGLGLSLDKVQEAAELGVPIRAVIWAHVPIPVKDPNAPPEPPPPPPPPEPPAKGAKGAEASPPPTPPPPIVPPELLNEVRVCMQTGGWWRHRIHTILL